MDRLKQKLVEVAQSGVRPLWDLPVAARCWWLGVVCLSVSVVPACLEVANPDAPLAILLIAPVLNALVVIATRPRERQPAFVVSFDYGGLATLALLAAYGPTAALAAFVGENVTGAFIADSSGTRPVWVRSAYNLAWGPPCILFSWSMRQLAPDRALEPVVIAVAWWVCNGLLVGTMVALARRHSPLEAIRLAVTQEGWLRVQECAVSVLAVIAWLANPVLLLVVVLLVIGQAMTGRRLFDEYQRTAAAHQEALAERRRAELEAEQARRDPLTRLANRRAYQEVLDAKPPASAALVMDLDHFKRVNDTFGHAVGDHVLAAVGGVMRRTLPPDAFCARLGGEEFCALLRVAVDDAELLRIAERVRLGVSELAFDGHAGLHPTVSIGAARRRVYETSVAEAVTRADQALYAAKRDGRNRSYIDGDRALPLAG